MNQNLTTKARYAAAVKALKAADVTTRINVRQCCRGCVSPEQLGLTDDTTATQPYAWTYGGQGGALRWDPATGEPVEDLPRRRGWGSTTSSSAGVFAYWNHGGPDLVAARAVVDAFTAQGFEVEWNGSEHQCPIVTVKAAQ
jgi:hypothetical protein